MDRLKIRAFLQHTLTLLKPNLTKVIFDIDFRYLIVNEDCICLQVKKYSQCQFYIIIELFHLIDNLYL